jgi:hypothetical protein
VLRVAPAALLLCTSLAAGAATRVRIDADLALTIDGKKVFPIGFTMPPPLDGKTPDGREAIGELARAGATFLRTGVMGGPWDDDAIAREQQWQDAAARNGMRCWVFLRELGDIGANQPQREAMLRKVVTRFRDHPGMGVWKGVDEPEWGKHALPPLVRAREIVRELDTNHPMAVTHAPRGTVASLRPYNDAADITGADIYPVGYPPGGHSLGTNKHISMVGDDLILLACKREGATVQAQFRGLPAGTSEGEVLCESPRTVTAADGQFTDWFGPFEVHVYRFRIFRLGSRR